MIPIGLRKRLAEISSGLFLTLFALVFPTFLTGCANTARAAANEAAVNAQVPGLEVFRGRLSVKIDALDTQAPGPPQGQFFSAAFELTGDAHKGELTLLSPLGNVLALLTWTPITATMNANGTARNFDSLDALIHHAAGVAIPVASLFSWLAGHEIPTAGWQADLSEYSSGRLVARRTAPLPNAELRLALER